MRPVLVLLFALRIAAAADANLAGYFPPDTRAVMGIRIQALGAAGIFQGIDGEIRKSASSVLEKGPLAGFDPLKDLDEVIVATNGAAENAPAVVVLLGRFPLDRLPAETARYKDTAIWESPEHPGGMIAFIDGTTAIAGEPEQVRAAIDRAGQSTGDAPWMPRMQALRGSCALWGFGEGLEGGGPAGNLSSVDRFEFGVALERGLRLAAEIHVRNPEDADKLAASLRMFEGMMKSDKKSAKNSGFSLKSDQGTLKFSLILPEAELKKAIAEERGALVAALSSGLPSFAQTRRVVPPPPPVPVSTEAKIETNSEGDTIVLTLPGGPIKN